MVRRTSGQVVGEVHCCVWEEEASERIQDYSIEVDLCRWEGEVEAAGR
jgi:hypothetical protein